MTFDQPGPWGELDTTPRGQCCNGIVETIIADGLTDIEGNVFIRNPPSLKQLNYPCVIVSQVAGTYSAADGGLSQPDRTFRFYLAIVAGYGDRAVNQDTNLINEWDDTIFRLFAKRRPFTLSGNEAQLEWTDVEEGDPAVIAAWQENINAAWLGIVCRVRYH